MLLSEIIQTALDKINYIAKTETIVGEPITVGEVTLIPVSKVSIGFAAGGGGANEKAGSGAGTGGGVNIIPVAFIAIIGDKVQVYPVTKREPDLGKILSLAPDLIKRFSRHMGKKEEKEKQEKETPPSSK